MDTIAIRIPATPELTRLVEEILKHPDVQVSMVKEQSEYLTVKQAAAEAQMSYSAFRRLVVDRRLVKHSRPSGPKGNLLIRRADLNAFLQGQKKPGRPGRRGRGVDFI